MSLESVIEELAHAIAEQTKVLKAMAGGQVQAAAAEPEKVQAAAAEPEKPKAEKAEPAKKSGGKKAPAKKAAPKKEEPPEEEDDLAGDDDTPEDDAVTREDCMAALKEAVENGHRQKVVDTLDFFNAKKLSGVDDDDLQEFYDKLQEAIGA